jgi:hypothetical protein
MCEGVASEILVVHPEWMESGGRKFIRMGGEGMFTPHGLLSLFILMRYGKNTAARAEIRKMDALVRKIMFN